MNFDLRTSNFHSGLRKLNRKECHLFLLTFLVAACSIVYELIFSQALTVVFGDTVTRYSITIGLYLFCLGLGSFAFSRVSHEKLHSVFWKLELLLGTAGVAGVFLIFSLGTFGLRFSNSPAYYAVLALAHLPVVVVGFLSGLEIPLLSQHVKYREFSFSEVLGVDYLGGLAGTLCYALILFPCFGLVTAAIFTGLLNIIVAAYYAHHYRQDLPSYATLLSYVVLIVFTAGLFLSSSISRQLSDQLLASQVYSRVRSDRVEVAEVLVKERLQTRYQLATIYDMATTTPVQGPGLISDTCLNLDSHVQFCSSWVQSYHAGLVDVPMSMIAKDKPEVLILGGGDWIPVRYLEPYQAEIELVDIDKAFVEFARLNSTIREFNDSAFDRVPVTVHYEDAFSFLRRTSRTYDLILVDLPGLQHDKLLHLYSVEFYKAALSHLNPNGLLVTWVYLEKRFPVHSDVLRNTLYEAGFRRYFRYYALQETYNSQVIGTELFYILSRSATPSVDVSRNTYISTHKDIYSVVPWKELLPTDSRPNTILHPNYNILIPS